MFAVDVDEAHRRYALHALDREVSELAATPKGGGRHNGRNQGAYHAAFNLGQFVGAGALSESVVRHTLLDVVRGFDPHAAYPIRSRSRPGLRSRGLCERHHDRFMILMLSIRIPMAQSGALNWECVMLDFIPHRLRGFLKDMLRIAVALLAVTGALAIVDNPSRAPSWQLILGLAVGTALRWALKPRKTTSPILSEALMEPR